MNIFHVLSYGHTERQWQRQIESIVYMVVLGNGPGTDLEHQVSP